jgi:superfamily I DNA and/or RNA helicase
VIITAFTKNAIRELIRAFHERYTIWVNGSRSFHASNWPTFQEMCCVVVSDMENEQPHKSEPYGLVKIPQNPLLTKLPQTPVQIICGTVHQLFKLRPLFQNTDAADVLIIDEASQLLLPDAVIPISLLKFNTGRLLLSGDHLQLPPLMKTSYPSPLPGKPELATSVLQAFLRASMDNQDADFLDATLTCPVLVQLKENQRSNFEIGAFIGQLYRRGYKIPKRREKEFVLKPKLEIAKSCQLLKNVLTSHHGASKDNLPFSLVMVNVSINGLLTAERERQMEAKIVKKLVDELRSACPKSHCFIPTPHRAQRFFIASELGTLLDEDIDGTKAVQVDTVDRMQGRQADCVLISALLCDIDLISSEADFLFSLNRLNVAMSRAKALCIFLTSSTLLDPSPEVLRSRAARVGYERIVAFQAASRAKIQISVDVEHSTKMKAVATWNGTTELCKWEWNL